LQVAQQNKDHETMKLFEIANVYEKKDKGLPAQMLRLSGLIRKPKVTFSEVKGVLEQLLSDVGIEEVTFKNLTENHYGASLHYGKSELGVIEIQDETTIDFELDMEVILKHVVLRKKYKPLSKYPAVVEDLAIIAPSSVLMGDLMETIAKQSELIASVSLLDKYKETRTFHVVFQSYTKNLTSEDVTPVREKILKALREKHSASLKS
jgi:phenylalanyl-tRNA synthetase beta chain